MQPWHEWSGHMAQYIVSFIAQAKAEYADVQQAVIRQLALLTPSQVEDCLKEQAANLLIEFKMSVKVCMEQRGHIAFLDEYLRDGVFYQDVLKKLAEKT
jgi:hypothetical protein